MIQSSDLRDEVIIVDGADILDLQEGWVSGSPFHLSEMLRAYKSGSIEKSRYVFTHLMKKMEAFDRALQALEQIESQYGKGCLLDLDDDQVIECIETAESDPEYYPSFLRQYENAKRYRERHSTT